MPSQPIRPGSLRALIRNVRTGQHLKLLIPMKRPTLEKLRKAVAEFNAQVKVGDLVRYREIRGEGEGTLYRTQVAAEILQGHSAVVWLAGKTGCVLIAHCEILPADQQGPQIPTATV